MKALTYLLIVLLFALDADAVSGQNKRSAKAYTTYDAGEYYAAIDQFKDAYQKTSDKKEKLNIAFYIAECYRKTDNSPQAALWYGKVIAKDYENPKSGLLDNFWNISGAHFFVMEPGVNIEMNLSRKLTLVAGVSYRYVTGLNENDENVSITHVTNEELSGLNFNIGLKFGKEKKNKN